MDTNQLAGGPADQVHRLLAEHQATVGPWVLDDDGDPQVDVPIPGAILAEWVVVMSWVDPGDGRHYTTRLTSPGLPSHHEIGLLHDALDM